MLFGELKGGGCLDLGLSSAAGQLLVLEPLRAGVASWERRENWWGGGERAGPGVTAVPTVACCGSRVLGWRRAFACLPVRDPGAGALGSLSAGLLRETRFEKSFPRSCQWSFPPLPPNRSSRGLIKSA